MGTTGATLRRSLSAMLRRAGFATVS